MGPATVARARYLAVPHPHPPPPRSRTHSAQDLLTALEELGREEGLRLRAADKRREKELLAGHSAELEARLAACEPGDGPAVLAVAVPLLLATHASK